MLYVTYDVQKATVICVVLLQNCVGFVEGETGYCSETCVMCGVDGTGEGIILEEAIDIKDETSQATTFQPIKTEHEVRLWCVCEVVTAIAFRVCVRW
jgi:hypothetical protein